METTELTPATELAWSLVSLLGDQPEALTDAHDAWFGMETEEWPADPVVVESVSSFEDAGVMTTNAGLVVRLANGAEFQITIVQSREATR